jgi:hypothetical protein
MRKLFLIVVLLVSACESNNFDNDYFEFDNVNDIEYRWLPKYTENFDKINRKALLQGESIDTYNLSDFVEDREYTYRECNQNAVWHCDENECWFDHYCKASQFCDELKDMAFCVDIEKPEYSGPKCLENKIVECFGNNVFRVCKTIEACKEGYFCTTDQNFENPKCEFLNDRY